MQDREEDAKSTTTRFANRVIDLLGGREEASRRLGAEFSAMASSWNQDRPLIGRILAAHLFVEHYLREYLQHHGADLDIDKARLSFPQVLTLSNIRTTHLSYLLPGITHLNKVRNRIAHTLRAEVTRDDANAFMSIEPFSAMRRALAETGLPNSEPIEVLEEFAMHAGMVINSTYSEMGRVFEKALGQAEETGSGNG